MLMFKFTLKVILWLMVLLGRGHIFPTTTNV